MPILLANSELLPAPGIEQPEPSVAGYPTPHTAPHALVVDTLSATARMLRNKKLLATSSTARISSYL